MKVLWLTSSPGGASRFLDVNVPGRGWITSLEDELKVLSNVELAVCFFYNRPTDFKRKVDKVTYYPIKDKLASFAGRLSTKIFDRLWDTNIADLLKVINDFQPDIIQLFGTETGLGEIVFNTNIPVIVHIQGLVTPLSLTCMPKGVSLNSLFINSSVKDILLKKDLRHDCHRYLKMAQREEAIIKKSKYFFGRTEYDKKITGLLNSHRRYFHCDEVLRPIIYDNEWAYIPSQPISLVSIINPHIYKGLDVVLESAYILKQKLKYDFTWSIIGIDDSNNIVRLLERVKDTKFSNNNVILKGIKKEDDLIKELLRSHIFVHPSHVDNSPNSVCEAMLLGMPVIAGNVGGLSTLIRNDYDGILYNSQDPYELAGNILKLAGDKETLQQLGKNAYTIARERHDRLKIVATVMETYQSIQNNCLQTN